MDGADSSEVSPGAVRGACKAWVATAKVGAARVPLCYQLMQDNKLVRFLSTMHKPSNPSDSNGDMKARWNKATREYMEVYIPAVKLSYVCCTIRSRLPPDRKPLTTTCHRLKKL